MITHPMDNYIRDRMIADAAHVLTLADQQSSIEHQGIKGRFRELLIDRLLTPWLPPAVQCATGTVISLRNIYRDKTQEDILLIDKDISPQILIDLNKNEGVFLRNSVLGRIEVKSNLEARHIKDFCKSCDEFHELGLDLDEERNRKFREENRNLMEINVLFGFRSQREKSTVFSWFKDVTVGKISIVCVPKHGLWKISNNGNWLEYTRQTKSEEPERLASFIALLSNTIFSQHIAFQGRDRLSSLEGGCGQYFNNWNSVEPIS